MTSKSFSANGPRGPFEDTIIIVLSKINVVGYVPLEVKSRSEIKPVSGLHAKVPPPILVMMPMRKPSYTRKNNIFLKELRTNVEVVERIQRLPDILLKPPNKTVKLIPTVHSICC